MRKKILIVPINGTYPEGFPLAVHRLEDNEPDTVIKQLLSILQTTEISLFEVSPRIMTILMDVNDLFRINFIRLVGVEGAPETTIYSNIVHGLPTVTMETLSGWLDVRDGRDVASLDQSEFTEDDLLKLLSGDSTEKKTEDQSDELQEPTEG